MLNKTALVSGGTSGVGLSIVKALVVANYTVFFIGSSKNKGLAVESELQNQTSNLVKFIELDLSNLNEVNNFTETFIQENDYLDLLVNVAGVLLPKRTLTNKGLEKTFAVGYLSSYLLIKNFTLLLAKSNAARIVNVSGNPIFVLKKWLNFKDFNLDKSYNQVLAAIKSVHAKTVLTSILAEELKVKNITINSFHPGLVKSSLTQNANVFIRIFHKLLNPFMKKDSKTGIYVCLSKELNNVTGKLFNNKTAIDLYFSKEYQQQLVQHTEQILAKVLK